MRLPSRTALPFPPHRILRLTVWSGVLCMATVMAQTGPTPGRAVIVAEVDGVIHPITSEFMRGAISRADSEDAAALVFVLRTPGGLVDSTRDIISRMLEAKTPIVVWVGPSGARAASAGFLLTLAADVSAMAPGTSIGAAHPVGAPGQAVDAASDKKAVSDLAAYARTIAARRGRNVALAEEAVVASRAFTDDEAHHADPPLVDVVAGDVETLLREIDGRVVKRFNGGELTLHTAGAGIERVEMTWRQRLLSAIAHPQIAYLLFTLGTLGLTIELWSPGAILPGVVGGLCLLLAFFAFQVLPVSYAGLALLVFGLLLLILEVKVTSFGVLALGGIISLVLGSLMLFDAPLPELRLGLRFVLPVCLGIAAVVLLLVRLAVNAQRLPATTGTAALIDTEGRALTPLVPGQPGQIAARGEIWTAISDEPIARHDPVEILSVDGLTVRVARAQRNGASE